jgi:hypothetical protein
MAAERIDAERAQLLSDELSELSKKQSEALQRAAYFKMAPAESAAYDKRAKRISELCALLSR